MHPGRPNFSETSRAGLGICLILGSLVFVFGGILLGMLSAHRAEQLEQGLDVTALDQQMLVHLAQKDHEVHGAALPAPAEKKAPLEEIKPAPVQVAVKPGPPVLEPAPPAPVAPVPMPGVDQKRVDLAIDKGVQYLKSHQNLNGTWVKGARPRGRLLCPARLDAPRMRSLRAGTPWCKKRRPLFAIKLRACSRPTNFPWPSSFWIAWVSRATRA